MSAIRHVGRQIDAYLNDVPGARIRLSGLVAHYEDDPASLLDRRCMRGHVTTSAITATDDLSHVLEILHRALGRWLQPGGHYEPPGTLFANAVREDVEETGVRGLRPFRTGRQRPLDVDTHPIPANPARNEGAHVHHDFAYLLTAPREQDFALQEDEVAGVRWTRIEDFARRDERAERIVGRMRDMGAAK